MQFEKKEGARPEGFWSTWREEKLRVEQLCAGVCCASSSAAGQHSSVVCSSSSGAVQQPATAAF